MGMPECQPGEKLRAGSLPDPMHGITEPPCRRPAAVLSWSEAEMETSPAVEPGAAGPFIALWRPAGVTAALGISQKPELELGCAAIRRDGVEVVRRQSGGGAVLLYPGVLCWEAWAGLEALAHYSENGGTGIREAYSVLTLPVRTGLYGMGVEVFQAGVSDLSWLDKENGAVRKLAGTAQFRKRDRVLVHGSLLLTADVEVLSKYLASPSVQPEYRGRRTHRDFCVTMKEILGADAEGDEALFARVAGAVRAAAEKAGWQVLVPPENLPAAAAHLENHKYLSPEWNWEKKRLF